MQRINEEQNMRKWVVKQQLAMNAMTMSAASLGYLFIGRVGKFADDTCESPVFSAKPFVLGFQFL